MSWFARIEEACAAFIEQTFARTFPSDLEPAHIARKLVSTMEARTVHEGDRASAPSRYHVRVNAGDFERLRPHQVYLEEEWAALLADMAQLVSISLAPPMLVRLHEDSSVVAGAVEIDVVADDESADEAPPSAKSYCLRMVRGLPLDAVYALDRPVDIGRGKANDIVVGDPRVSRRHARIDGRTLVDLGSTNGTFIDGAPVSGRAQLRPGNVITLGNTSLRFEEALR